MMQKILTTLCLLASLSTGAQRLTYKEQVQLYINTYKDLAMEEQRRSGIPAAVTLGQGILETQAGGSELSTVAHNHFGIKCKKEWTGETFAHDDDAPQECFRKYTRAEDSYKDHSDYLKSSKRYASCFALGNTDYAGWATELRKCGYATNPKYAQILIKIIEDNHLQEYTYAALAKKEPVLLASAGSPVAAVMMSERAAETRTTTDNPAPQEERKEWGKVVKKDGVKGFWAHKGEVLLAYAIQNNIRYAKLLELNGLPDAPLMEDKFVYLEKGGAVAMPVRQETARVDAPTAAIVRPVSNTSPAYISTGNGTLAKESPAPVIAKETEAPSPEAAQEVAQEVKTDEAEETPVPVATTEAVAETPAPVVEPVREVVKKEEKKADAQSTGMVVKEEGPQDAFSKMKAQMDKVVYAPKTKSAPQPAPAVQSAPAPAPVQSLASGTAAGVHQYHTVQTGDTAFGISKRYGITMKQLMDWNSLNFEAIKVGQKLRVK